ncbi:MAG: hypothetical protein V2I43_15250 [Parvularcula sp.]|nr:hypothetical protein [Parvularcula sp.]
MTDDWKEVGHADETVVFARGNAVGYTSYGIEYLKRDISERLTWQTHIVGTQDDEKFWVSISVACESPFAGVHIPSPKKPYIIRQILDHFGGGEDAGLVISQESQHLSDSEHDLRIASSVINGDAMCKMPVVYVSRTDDDGLAVDAGEMARWLAGMAHVLVEPSRGFSFLLRDHTGARNVYGGSVGVYWPLGIEFRPFHPWGKYEDPRDLMTAVTHTVRHGLIGQRQIEQCTWAHLKELRVRSQIESLRASGTASIDEYVTAFDEEMQLKDERLARANDEIQRLQALLRARPETRLQSGDPVLVAGSETDLYDAEIRSILCEILKKAASECHEDGRRQHVLKDVLAANKRGSRRDEIEEQLRSAFSKYKKMDANTKAILNKLGFSLKEDGKHYKLMFCNDPRYQFTIPKTSSDHRAGKNIVSQIKNGLL